MLCASSVAAAQPLVGELERPPSEVAADEAVDEGRLEAWPWAVSVPLLGISLLLEATIDVNEARWSGRGPIDEGFESWIRDTRQGRHRADVVSDIFLYTMFAAPVLDAALWRDGPSPSRDTYRLLAADALAFSVETLVVVATKLGFRRARPYDRGCRAEEDYTDECDSDSRYRSFISGHTAAAFTGASLVCAHQRLRGLSPLGRVECVASLLLASLTAAMRVAAAKHYFADVATSAVVGFLSGFVLPIFVYPRALPRPPAPRQATRAAW